MPGIGYAAKNLIIARSMLEHCRFAYKAYAQTCKYPLDPFFESDGHGPRKLLMEVMREVWGTEGQGREKFDPVEYVLDETPDPRHGVVYRDQDGDHYILFQPRALDERIGYARGFDLDGLPVDDGISIAPTSTRCCYFQGRTGMTEDEPGAGWRSWLGAVVHDAATGICVIVWRGSRSGSNKRAILQAEFQEKGSPDWVTDMQYLEATPPLPELHGATLGTGFHHAYESCKRSLDAAYAEAVNGERPTAVYLTGHSLGGALAQCAYLDFTMGSPPRGAEGVPVACYPISAPPVVLGRASHWKIALAADATRIFHYFCPHDAVHGGPLCSAPGVKLVNEIMAATADPFHIGCEIALPSDASFPSAHEPEEVWKGMHDGASDPAFWPRFAIHHLGEDGPFVTDLPADLTGALRAALATSVRYQAAADRARHWLSVTEDGARLDPNGEGELSRAIELVRQLEDRGASGRLEGLDRLKAYRRSLLAGYEGARGSGRTGIGGEGFLGRDGYRAISSCYWVMLQCLTASQVEHGC